MDRKKLFPIGEVSKMFHISVSSLRHYEHIGLLNPEYISPNSGYRYYSVSQFEILNTIRYLRALDMPLDEIKDFIQNKNIESIEKKLRQQKEEVIKKQRELARIERKIDNRLRYLSDAQNIPSDSVSVIKTPACRMVWMDAPPKINGSADLEEPIRELDKSSAEAVVFLGKVGLSITKEHLNNGETAQYDGIFLILDKEDIYTGETIDLPETLCVRIRFKGSHSEAGVQYKKLLGYIKEHKMRITGFSREITLIDYGITNDTEKFVTEICIPTEYE